MLKDFNHRLSIARREKGYTQEELAVKLGVTPQAVSKWERGGGYPDLELLYHICDILNCSSDYLLDRERCRMKLTESDDDLQKKVLLNEILAEPLMLEFGMGLIPCIMEEKDKQFPGIKALRERLAKQYGVLFPVLRIRDSIDMEEYDYRILTYDQVLYSGTAEMVNSFQNICGTLEKITLENYHKILNRQMVQVLIDNLADKYPAAVRGVVPDKIPISMVQQVITGLIDRKKSIRNFIKIMEVLEDARTENDSMEDIINLIINRLEL